MDCFICLHYIFLSHKIFFPFPLLYGREPRNLIQGCPKDHPSSVPTQFIQFWSITGTFWLVPTLKSWRYFLIQTGVLALFSSEWFISQLWFILMANISHNRKTKSNKVTILAFTKYQIPSLLSSLGRGTWQLQRLGFPNPYQRVCFGLLNLGKRLSV